LDTTIQSPLIDTIKRLLGIVSRHITVSLCVAQYLNSIIPKSTGIAPTSNSGQAGPALPFFLRSLPTTTKLKSDGDGLE
jgi:hypothetical protein